MTRIKRPRRKFFTASRLTKRYRYWWAQNRRYERYGIIPFLYADAWIDDQLWKD